MVCVVCNYCFIPFSAIAARSKWCSRGCQSKAFRERKARGEVQTPLPHPDHCTLEGCKDKYYAKGMCIKHHARMFRLGTTEITRIGPLTYKGAHHRVSTTRGKATQFQCVDCSSPAREWSYSHKDPEEMLGSNGNYVAAYSTDPSYYDPRCISCHRSFDRSRDLVRA